MISIIGCGFSKHKPHKQPKHRTCKINYNIFNKQEKFGIIYSRGDS